jgi:hypothetical protein
MTYQVGPPQAASALLSALVLAVTATMFTAPAATALDEQPGEEAAIQECDKRLCAILLEKDRQGPDLKCRLTKTWARSQIKEAESQRLSWGFGDARCTVEINLSRDRLVAVMTGERTAFHVTRHTAHCVVEQDGRLEKVKAVLSPKIEFKNGKADKVWVRLKSVEGPSSVTYVVETAAQLADTFGLFHRQMLKGINRYIERHCPATLSVAATPPAAAKNKAGK